VTPSPAPIPFLARPWPLHPKPGEWEGLETWVRRIAAAYGVGYDAFLHHALGRTGRGARNLDDLDEASLARLAAGAGVPVERLRAMRPGAMMGRINGHIQGWLMTEEGRAALEELRVSLRRMAYRGGTDTRDGYDRHVIAVQENLGSIDGATAYVTS